MKKLVIPSILTFVSILVACGAPDGAERAGDTDESILIGPKPPQGCVLTANGGSGCYAHVYCNANDPSGEYVVQVEGYSSWVDFGTSTSPNPLNHTQGGTIAWDLGSPYNHYRVCTRGFEYYPLPAPGHWTFSDTCTGTLPVSSSSCQSGSGGTGGGGSGGTGSSSGVTPA